MDLLHCAADPLQQRIDYYREQYESLSPHDAKDYGFIQVMDLCSYFVATKIHSPLEFRIMKYGCRRCP